MRHLRNDIALLQLEQPIQASDKVNTVCLPDSGSKVQGGTQCYITGIVIKWLKFYSFDSIMSGLHSKHNKSCELIENIQIKSLLSDTSLLCK